MSLVRGKELVLNERGLVAWIIRLFSQKYFIVEKTTIWFFMSSLAFWPFPISTPPPPPIPPPPFFPSNRGLNSLPVILALKFCLYTWLEIFACINGLNILMFFPYSGNGYFAYKFNLRIPLRPWLDCFNIVPVFLA